MSAGAQLCVSCAGCFCGSILSFLLPQPLSSYFPSSILFSFQFLEMWSLECRRVCPASGAGREASPSGQAPGCGRQRSPTSPGLACTSGSGVRWGLGCICGDGWRAGWSFEGTGGGAVGRNPQSGRGLRGTMPAAAGVPPAAGKPVLCNFHREGPPPRREPALVPPALRAPSTFRNLCWTGYSTICPNQTSATCSLCFSSRVAPNPALLLQLRLIHSPTQRGLPFFSDYRSRLVSTRAASKLASFLFSFG